jgi:hypothetical protein
MENLHRDSAQQAFLLHDSSLSGLNPFLGWGRELQVCRWKANLACMHALMKPRGLTGKCWLYNNDF